MKFLQANLVTALLAATTFAAPSTAARLKHLREGEGDLKNLEKSTDDIDIDVDLTSTVPDIAFHHGGSSSSSNDEDSPDPLCYIGGTLLAKQASGADAICCDMPPLYYNFLPPAVVDMLEDAGCKTGTASTRPACYSTGTQITFWLFWSKSVDGVTNYPVCEGAVISPGDFFTGGNETNPETNFEAFVNGALDGPVVVSIPGLHLHCPTEDCTFNGGQFQIVSFPKLSPLEGPLASVNDISGLTIEGFTFTGTMTSLPNEFNQNKYSIFLEVPGTNVIIKNNLFKDISNPIEDGIDCNVYREYTAVHAQEPDDPPFQPYETLQVSIENNVFEKIDVGSFPVYADNRKDCNLCFKETKMMYSKPASFIVNKGQEVNLVGNVIKKNTAHELYFALPSDSACEENCYKATISGNTFWKNDVNSIITLIKPEYANVSFDNNEGECDQRYTGGMRCPVRRREKDDFFDLSLAVTAFEVKMSPLENCDGSKFCYSENRASMFSRVDQNVCGEWLI